MPTDVIIGSNSPNYTFGPLDVGNMIYCRVKATNVAGFAFRDTAQVGPIAPAAAGQAPVNTFAPAIDAPTPEVDEVLFCTEGTWTGDPTIVFAYQWFRVAAPTPPSITTAPDIADTTPQVDEVLHVTDGMWDGTTPITFNYQWFRVTAPGAPSIVTAPDIADITPEVDETLHVTDGTWDGDTPITFNYQWYRVTPDAVPPSGGTPSIADTTPVENETLHCDHGTWSGDVPITYAYQWKRGATSVGIDSADYTLGPADVGAAEMSCVVTASNAAGSASATSNVVGPVTAAPIAPSGGVPSIGDTTPEVDEILNVNPGTWAGTTPITFGYQWYQVGTAPTVTSASTASNVENSVLAHGLTADQAVTWSIVGGADQARFELSGSTLRWLSNATKNFEAPNDADLNNAYIVTVRATATTGQHSDQTVTVTVTNIVVETTLTFDFAANTSTIAGTAANSTAPLTVTRAGAAFFAERLDGVWTSFGANTARRTDKGLLIEEARTNVCLQNRTLTNASWVKTSCTAVKDQTGIDGVASSASRITATAGNATCLLTTTIASSARFQTAFVKRLVGTGTIQMTMDNGTTWTTVTTTASWSRVSIPTQTLANPVVGFRIVTSGDSIAVDMVQNENSALYATSPIPTTTATVTRAADVVVINTAVAPLASWFNEPAGTLFAEGVPYTGTLPTSTAFQIDSGAASNLHYVGLPGATAAAGGTTTASTVVGTFNGTNAAGVNKSAWAYAANDMAGSFNGGAPVTDVTGAMPTGLTTARLGKLVAATNWSGYLQKITYMNGRLSNAELVTLTTVVAPAISLVCGPVYASVTDTDSVAATITFPVTPAIGDVVYVFGGTTLGAIPISIATPGYTELATVSMSVTSKLFRKVLNAVETTVTTGVNYSGYVTMIGAIVLRGVNTTTPEDATVTTSSSPTLTPPITTVNANSWVLAIQMGGSTSPSPATAGPAGYSNFAAAATGIGSTSGNSLDFAAATKLVATAGVEDPGNFTHTYDLAHNYTVAVRKA